MNYDPPPIGPRRLTRSSSDRMVAGVCGGVAAYLGVDTTLVRIGFALLALTGVGVIAYAIGWALLPEEGEATPRWRPIWQVAAVAVAVLLLADFVDVWNVDEITVPLALLAIGAVLVWGARGEEPAPLAVRADAGAVDAGPDIAMAVTTADPTRAMVEQTGPGRWSWAPPPSAGSPTGAPSEPAPPRRQRPGGGRAAAVGIGGVLLAIGAIGLAIALSDGIAPTMVLGLALAAFGVTMAAVSWRGGARPLAFGGMALVVAIAAVAVIDVPVDGGIGEREVDVNTAAELRPVERLAAGELTIDLTDLVLTGDERHFEASVAAGELIVEVPRGLTVEVHGEVGLGEIDVFEVNDEGWSKEVDDVFEGSGEGRIELDLRVGFGHLEVRRG